MAAPHRQARAKVDCGSVLSTASELASGSHGGTTLSALAREIFRWKQEIIDGVARDPRPHRSNSERSSQSGGWPGRSDRSDADALFAGGHILLEGPPGIAKTLLAQTFARCLGLEFGRIQFTPDLMPGDILGVNLFNFQTGGFTVTRGPIFCELLLADEINRTPPKTQAALLEAMQERRITLDGKAHPLSERFMVVATENPIEQQGTYPLPEAQLDRFLFKHVLGYPTEEEEREVVRRHGHRSAMPRLEEFGLRPVADFKVLALMRELVARIRLSEELLDYVVDVIRGTREHASLEVGASTRAANMLAAAARAYVRR